jgi:hypothetical protein
MAESHYLLMDHEGFQRAVFEATGKYPVMKWPTLRIYAFRR